METGGPLRLPHELLGQAIDEFGPRFVILTSFQKEGMVIVDMASRLGKPVRVMTLDTGRLPEETLLMIGRVRQRYGIEVESIYPDTAEVNAMVAAHGPDLFRNEPALRKLCCQVRKVRPLERALANIDAYSTGLRREQAESRADAPQVLQENGKWKLNPLAHWNAAQVESYIAANNVPLHPLYARGYASIGCAPCTRAIQPGEGERAGRWWWEAEGDKECGLHFTADGRLVRKVDVLLGELLNTNA